MECSKKFYSEDEAIDIVLGQEGSETLISL
jgi:hypothetical protein